MGHNVGTAADNAVQKSNKKQAHEERSVEQVIKDIRNNLNARLAVTSSDIRILLIEYDRLDLKLAEFVSAASVSDF